jgi:predicted nucleic acid-binding protein
VRNCRDGESDLLLVDDALARRAAAALGLRVKGTLGVLAQAFQTGLLTVEQRDAAFEALLERDDIWLSGVLIRRIWDELRRSDWQQGGC